MQAPGQFVNARYQLAESPYWSSEFGGLFWVDILARKLCFSSAGEAPREWHFDQKVTSCAGAEGGRLILSQAKSLVLFDPISGKSEELCQVEPDLPGNRCNDGAVDPMGNFWFGTMDDREESACGALYCVPRGHCEPLCMAEGVGIANTLAWDEPRSRMYFADSMRGELYCYPIDWQAGPPRLGPRRVFFVTPSGTAPDGSCADADGRLYNARWGGGIVAICDPDGEEVDAIKLSARYVTSCCFGGEGGDTLFITSAAPPELDDPGEHGGAVFSLPINERQGARDVLFDPC